MISFTTIAHAQSIAITMDNPNTKQTPVLDAVNRDKKILDVLNKKRLKIVLFVQGAQVADPLGHALLIRWNAAGQTLGNHTYSHASYNTVDEAIFEQDTLRNAKFLEPYSHFKKIFRFPFLKEGDTAAKRDGFREFLNQQHYQLGSVTIDTSDWYISDRLEKKLAEHPDMDISAYKKYYLNHIWNRAQYYDGLARKLLGRSPNHTLLVHHNLLNALFLADVINMLESKGWKLINAEKAFSDPLFKLRPKTTPAGESIIWALAKESGYDNLRYPGEDGTYEKEQMDKLGL